MGKNIKEIVKEHLVLEKYDGLVDEDEECGCDLEELMDCDMPSIYCVGGYKVICGGCADNAKGGHYHIAKKKPKALEEVER